MNNMNFILNSSNYDSARSVFAYRLPIPQTFIGKRVGLSYASIYKQFDNVLANYGNNTFTITWCDGINYTITIPDGNYSVSQINEYLQYFLVQNKLYVTDNNGKIVSFIELVTNPPAYGTSIFTYPVPTSASASSSFYSKPAGATWSYPVSGTSPTITVGENFGKLIGFNAGTYGAGSVSQAVNSMKTPQIAVVNSLLIRTNLVNNEHTNPNDAISAMDLNGEYGTLMVKDVGQILYSNIAANKFFEIVVYFSDQNYNKLSIKDPEVCIHLSIVE